MFDCRSLEIYFTFFVLYGMEIMSFHEKLMLTNSNKNHKPIGMSDYRIALPIWQVMQPYLMCGYSNGCISVKIVKPNCSNGFLEYADSRYVNITLVVKNCQEDTKVNNASLFILWLWGSTKNGSEIYRCRFKTSCKVPTTAVINSARKRSWLDIVFFLRNHSFSNKFSVTMNSTSRKKQYLHTWLASQRKDLSANNIYDLTYKTVGMNSLIKNVHPKTISDKKSQDGVNNFTNSFLINNKSYINRLVKNRSLFKYLLQKDNKYKSPIHFLSGNRRKRSSFKKKLADIGSRTNTVSHKSKFGNKHSKTKKWFHLYEMSLLPNMLTSFLLHKEKEPLIKRKRNFKRNKSLDALPRIISNHKPRKKRNLVNEAEDLAILTQGENASDKDKISEMIATDFASTMDIDKPVVAPYESSQQLKVMGPLGNLRNLDSMVNDLKAEKEKEESLSDVSETIASKEAHENFHLKRLRSDIKREEKHLAVAEVKKDQAESDLLANTNDKMTEVLARRKSDAEDTVKKIYEKLHKLKEEYRILKATTETTDKGTKRKLHGLVVIDPMWGDWSPWSKCSVDCGEGGFSVRRRDCDTLPDVPCDGISFDMRPCNTGLRCEAQWQEWGAWGPCSMTCGKGVRAKSRVCMTGDKEVSCKGESSRLEKCNLPLCEDQIIQVPVSEKRAVVVNSQKGIPKAPLVVAPRSAEAIALMPYAWGLWGQWASCSKNCGEGRQIRVRVCLDESKTTLIRVMVKHCNGGSDAQSRSCMGACVDPVYAAAAAAGGAGLVEYDDTHNGAYVVEQDNGQGPRVVVESNADGSDKAVVVESANAVPVVVAGAGAVNAGRDDDENSNLSASTILFIILLIVCVILIIIAFCIWFCSRIDDIRFKKNIESTQPLYNDGDDPFTKGAVSPVYGVVKPVTKGDDQPGAAPSGGLVKDEENEIETEEDEPMTPAVLPPSELPTPSEHSQHDHKKPRHHHKKPHKLKSHEKKGGFFFNRKNRQDVAEEARKTGGSRSLVDTGSQSSSDSSPSPGDDQPELKRLIKKLKKNKKVKPDYNKKNSPTTDGEASLRDSDLGLSSERGGKAGGIVEDSDATEITSSKSARSGLRSRTRLSDRARRVKLWREDFPYPRGRGSKQRLFGARLAYKNKIDLSEGARLVGKAGAANTYPKRARSRISHIKPKTGFSLLDNEDRPKVAALDAVGLAERQHRYPKYPVQLKATSALQFARPLRKCTWPCVLQQCEQSSVSSECVYSNTGGICSYGGYHQDPDMQNVMVRKDISPSQMRTQFNSPVDRPDSLSSRKTGSLSEVETRKSASLNLQSPSRPATESRETDLSSEHSRQLSDIESANEDEMIRQPSLENFNILSVEEKINRENDATQSSSTFPSNNSKVINFSNDTEKEESLGDREEKQNFKTESSPRKGKPVFEMENCTESTSDSQSSRKGEKVKRPKKSGAASKVNRINFVPLLAAVDEMYSDECYFSPEDGQFSSDEFKSQELTDYRDPLVETEPSTQPTTWSTEITETRDGQSQLSSYEQKKECVLKIMQCAQYYQKSFPGIQAATQTDSGSFSLSLLENIQDKSDTDTNKVINRNANLLETREIVGSRETSSWTTGLNSDQTLVMKNDDENEESEQSNAFAYDANVNKNIELMTSAAHIDTKKLKLLKTLCVGQSRVKIYGNSKFCMCNPVCAHITDHSTPIHQSVCSAVGEPCPGSPQSACSCLCGPATKGEHWRVEQVVSTKECVHKSHSNTVCDPCAGDHINWPNSLGGPMEIKGKLRRFSKVKFPKSVRFSDSTIMDSFHCDNFRGVSSRHDMFPPGEISAGESHESQLKKMLNFQIQKFMESTKWTVTKDRSDINIDWDLKKKDFKTWRVQNTGFQISSELPQSSKEGEGELTCAVCCSLDNKEDIHSSSYDSNKASSLIPDEPSFYTPSIEYNQRRDLQDKLCSCDEGTISNYPDRKITAMSDLSQAHETINVDKYDCTLQQSPDIFKFERFNNLLKSSQLDSNFSPVVNGQDSQSTHYKDTIHFMTESTFADMNYYPKESRERSYDRNAESKANVKLRPSPTKQARQSTILSPIHHTGLHFGDSENQSDLTQPRSKEPAEGRVRQSIVRFCDVPQNQDDSFVTAIEDHAWGRLSDCCTTDSYGSVTSEQSSLLMSIDEEEEKDADSFFTMETLPEGGLHRHTLAPLGPSSKLVKSRQSPYADPLELRRSPQGLSSHREPFKTEKTEKYLKLKYSDENPTEPYLQKISKAASLQKRSNFDGSLLCKSGEQSLPSRLAAQKRCSSDPSIWETFSHLQKGRHSAAEKERLDNRDLSAQQEKIDKRESTLYISSDDSVQAKSTLCRRISDDVKPDRSNLRRRKSDDVKPDRSPLHRRTSDDVKPDRSPLHKRTSDDFQTDQTTLHRRTSDDVKPDRSPLHRRTSDDVKPDRPPLHRRTSDDVKPDRSPLHRRTSDDVKPDRSHLHRRTSDDVKPDRSPLHRRTSDDAKPDRSPLHRRISDDFQTGQSTLYISSDDSVEAKSTLHRRTSDDVRPDRSNLHRRTSDDVRPDQSNLHRRTSDDVRPDRSNLRRKTSDDVRPDRSNLHRRTSDDVKPDRSTLRRRTSDDVKSDRSTLHRRTSDDVKPDQSTLRRRTSDDVKPDQSPLHRRLSDDVKPNRSPLHRRTSDDVKPDQSPLHRRTSDDVKPNRSPLPRRTSDDVKPDRSTYQRRTSDDFQTDQSTLYRSSDDIHQDISTLHRRISDQSADIERLHKQDPSSCKERLDKRESTLYKSSDDVQQDRSTLHRRISDQSADIERLDKRDLSACKEKLDKRELTLYKSSDDVQQDRLTLHRRISDPSAQKEKIDYRESTLFRSSDDAEPDQSTIYKSSDDIKEDKSTLPRRISEPSALKDRLGNRDQSVHKDRLEQLNLHRRYLDGSLADMMTERKESNMEFKPEIVSSQFSLIDEGQPSKQRKSMDDCKQSLPRTESNQGKSDQNSLKRIASDDPGCYQTYSLGKSSQELELDQSGQARRFSDEKNPDESVQAKRFSDENKPGQSGQARRFSDENKQEQSTQATRFSDENKKEQSTQATRFSVENKQEQSTQARGFLDQTKPEQSTQARRFSDETKPDQSGQARRFSDEKIPAQSTLARRFSDENKPDLFNQARRFSDENKPDLSGQARRFSDENKPDLSGQSRRFSDENKPDLSGQSRRFSDKNKPDQSGQARRFSDENKPDLSTIDRRSSDLTLPDEHYITSILPDPCTSDTSLYTLKPKVVNSFAQSIHPCDCRPPPSPFRQRRSIVLKRDPRTGLRSVCYRLDEDPQDQSFLIEDKSSLHKRTSTNHKQDGSNLDVLTPERAARLKISLDEFKTDQRASHTKCLEKLRQISLRKRKSNYCSLDQATLQRRTFDDVEPRQSTLYRTTSDDVGPEQPTFHRRTSDDAKSGQATLYRRTTSDDVGPEQTAFYGRSSDDAKPDLSKLYRKMSEQSTLHRRISDDFQPEHSSLLRISGDVKPCLPNLHRRTSEYVEPDQSTLHRSSDDFQQNQSTLQRRTSDDIKQDHSTLHRKTFEDVEPALSVLHKRKSDDVEPDLSTLSRRICDDIQRDNSSLYRTSNDVQKDQSSLYRRTSDDVKPALSTLQRRTFDDVQRDQSTSYRRTSDDVKPALSTLQRRTSDDVQRDQSSSYRRTSDDVKLSLLTLQRRTSGDVNRDQSTLYSLYDDVQLDNGKLWSSSDKNILDQSTLQQSSGETLLSEQTRLFNQSTESNVRFLTSAERTTDEESFRSVVTFEASMNVLGKDQSQNKNEDLVVETSLTPSGMLSIRDSLDPPVPGNAVTSSVPPLMPGGGDGTKRDGAMLGKGKDFKISETSSWTESYSTVNTDGSAASSAGQSSVSDLSSLTSREMHSTFFSPDTDDPFQPSGSGKQLMSSTDAGTPCSTRFYGAAIINQRGRLHRFTFKSPSVSRRRTGKVACEGLAANPLAVSSKSDLDWFVSEDGDLEANNCPTLYESLNSNALQGGAEMGDAGNVPRSQHSLQTVYKESLSVYDNFSNMSSVASDKLLSCKDTSAPTSISFLSAVDCKCPLTGQSARDDKTWDGHGSHQKSKPPVEDTDEFLSLSLQTALASSSTESGQVTKVPQMPSTQSTSSVTVETNQSLKDSLNDTLFFSPDATGKSASLKLVQEQLVTVLHEEIKPLQEAENQQESPKLLENVKTVAEETIIQLAADTKMELTPVPVCVDNTQIQLPLPAIASTPLGQIDVSQECDNQQLQPVDLLGLSADSASNVKDSKQSSACLHHYLQPVSKVHKLPLAKVASEKAIKTPKTWKPSHMKVKIKCKKYNPSPSMQIFQNTLLWSPDGEDMAGGAFPQQETIVEDHRKTVNITEVNVFTEKLARVFDGENRRFTEGACDPSQVVLSGEIKSDRSTPNAPFYWHKKELFSEQMSSDDYDCTCFHSTYDNTLSDISSDILDKSGTTDQTDQPKKRNKLNAASVLPTLLYSKNMSKSENEEQAMYNAGAKQDSAAAGRDILDEGYDFLRAQAGLAGHEGSKTTGKRDDYSSNQPDDLSSSTCSCQPNQLESYKIQYRSTLCYQRPEFGSEICCVDYSEQKSLMLLNDINQPALGFRRSSSDPKPRPVLSRQRTASKDSFTQADFQIKETRKKDAYTSTPTYSLKPFAGSFVGEESFILTESYVAKQEKPAYSSGKTTLSKTRQYIASLNNTNPEELTASLVYQSNGSQTSSDHYYGEMPSFLANNLPHHAVGDETSLMTSQISMVQSSITSSCYNLPTLVEQSSECEQLSPGNVGINVSATSQTLNPFDSSLFDTYSESLQRNTPAFVSHAGTTGVGGLSFNESRGPSPWDQQLEMRASPSPLTPFYTRRQQRRQADSQDVARQSPSINPNKKQQHFADSRRF